MHSTAAYRRDTHYGLPKRGLLRTEGMLLQQRVKHSSSFDINSDLLVDDEESTQWERANQLLSETTSYVLGAVAKLRTLNTLVISFLDKDDITLKRTITVDRYKALRDIADTMSVLSQDYELDRQEILGLVVDNEPHSTRVLTEELVMVMGNSAATIRQYIVNMRLLFSRIEEMQVQGGQFLTAVSGDELWERRTKFYEYAL